MKRKRIFTIFLAAVLSISTINIFPEKINAAETNEWNFEYTGSVEEFTAPYTGKYYIEAYSASGGGATEELGGLGGRSTGYINLKKGEKIYIACGGQGYVSSESEMVKGGWNGGGNGYHGAGSGGGATSITTTNRGELRNFKDNTSEILLVVSGGGGKGSNQQNVVGFGTYKPIGLGGDINGYRTTISKVDVNQFGGTLYGDCEYVPTLDGEPMWAIYSSLISNNFGYGGDSNSKYNAGYGGAGGGGYYGGNWNFIGIQGGAGGTSYKSEYIYEYEAHVGEHIGNGHVKIQYVGKYQTTITINTNNSCKINNNTENVLFNVYSGDTFNLPTPIMNDGFHFNGYSMVSGDGILNEDTYEVGFENSILQVNFDADLKVTSNVIGDINTNTQKLQLNFIQPDNTEKIYRVFQSIDKKNWYYANYAEDAVGSQIPTYKYLYTGKEKTLNIKNNSYIQMKVWGAEGGGDDNATGGYGGYAYGEKQIDKNTTLYINVGERGIEKWSQSGRLAYNGGGAATRQTGAGGGGLTHIATKSGQLYEFENADNASKYVLLCAGGGGGASDNSRGGSGGGISGGRGTGSNAPSTVGTQNSGYAFGRGQDAYGQGAAGGGGWYGGYGVTVSDIGSGGSGGSGWIGGVDNGMMQNGVRSGHGYAEITLIDTWISEEYLTDIYVPDKEAPDAPYNGIISGTNNDNIVVSWEKPDDNGSMYYHQVKSYKKEDISLLLKESEIIENYIETGIKGYHYYIDKNSTGTATLDNAFVDTESLEIPTDTGERYIHVASVDNAGNISGTYTIKIPSIAKYTVKHYAQNEDGTYTLVETEELTGTIGTTVTPEVHSQTGRDNPEKKSVVITADGKAVVEYYYDITRYNISGTVQWNDHENEYGTRPSDVDVTIYREGAEVGIVTVPASATSNRYSFKNMQKYNLTTGALLNYTVSQSTAYSQAALITTEDKYTTTNSGFDFLNTIKNTDLDKPENPSEGDKGFYLDGNIIWEDNENSLGFRPDNVSIQLWQKGEAGEFIKYREPIIVDADTENYYSFDWLPKYWYDENDIPTAYEYKTEEIFSAWYVQNGEMKDAYTINADMPDKFDFTNVLNIPDGSIIPVNQYENTLIVKTNSEEEIRIILKPLELNIDNNFNVSYGNKTEEDTEVLTNKEGNTVTGLPSTRYEVFVDSKEYDISDMELSLAENMELEEIDGKWYLTIHNQPEDSIGTLTINLTKKEVYYQDCCRISNIYAHISEASVEAMLTNEISTFSLIAADAVTVEYMVSEVETETYSIGDEVEIPDYVGKIPEDMKFSGWAISENGEVEYIAGDTIIIANSIKLYPVFKEIKEENSDVNIVDVNYLFQ